MTLKELTTFITAEFQKTYGRAPRYIAAAPGRVNVIGEHTDYNDGYVMPIAIDRHTEVIAAPRDDGKVHVASRGFGTPVVLSLTEPRDHPRGAAGVADAWSLYVQAVIWALQDSGYALRGADLQISSDVPPGAGLSSSRRSKWPADTRCCAWRASSRR